MFLCRGRILCTFCAAAENWFCIFPFIFLGTFYFVFCTQFDGTTYSNEGSTITQHRHEYITQSHSSCLVEHITNGTHTSFMHIYISFTVPLALQPPDSILLSDLGPLHLRIPPIPLELLVRDPLVEDRPATVRSNLKKGSIYMNETKHNWWQ